jgi:hypothetical protein
VGVKKEEDQLIAQDMALDSDVTRTRWQAFKDRIKSIFTPFGGSKASLDKESLSEQIGKTGGLIVGAGSIPVDTKPAETKVEPEAMPAEPQGTADMPWELQALQSGTLGKATIPAVEPKPEAPNGAAENNKVEDTSWELQELENLRREGQGAEGVAAELASARPKDVAAELASARPNSTRIKSESGSGGEDQQISIINKEINMKTKPNDIKENPELIEDVEGAHPEVKLIEDVEHAHDDVKQLPEPEKDE